MVFENIDWIKELSPEERLKNLGTKRKRKVEKRIYRSNMMINPLNLEHLNRIDSLEADMITLNLEDAIAPERKREALINIALFISHLEESNSFIIVRINPFEDGGREEIAFLNGFRFEAIRATKIKEANEIEDILKVLDKGKELHISLETKEAFFDIKSLKVNEQVTTFNIGILDLLNSLNLPQSVLNFGSPTIDYILSKFLIESKSIGVRPISFMYQDYNNLDEFRKWCERERDMGFRTKACMGPKQVEIANEIFGHTKEEIERAKYIKEIFEKNAQEGNTGFLDEKYGFIDEPIYKDALLILEGS